MFELEIVVCWCVYSPRSRVFLSPPSLCCPEEANRLIAPHTISMRWCVCKQWGPPSSLSIEDGPPLPQPGKGEVAIAVSACAVNFPDLLVVQVCAREETALNMLLTKNTAGEVGRILCISGFLGSGKDLREAIHSGVRCTVHFAWRFPLDLGSVRFSVVGCPSVFCLRGRVPLNALSDWNHTVCES